VSFTYRPDIDGLRAVAVIPVILFHADVSNFTGGYVGVDIFFVISGYLITNVLMKDINHGKFSLLRFYERRIRRLFPALFTVLIVSTCVASWIMFPSELNNYGKSLFSATLFYSNYHFMFDAGYFTSPAETKPLLHMWSLAVEEQFYILFPVYLYLASRFFKNKVGIATVAILLASLLYSIVIVYTAPADAYYSTPARAWELMVGSVLAIYPRGRSLTPRMANFLTTIGLSAIIYSILFFTKETLFPGPMALFPVIGSALIIFAGESKKNFVGTILTSNIFRYPGLISYSLYLWHWPVLVLYKMYAVGPVSDIEIAILIGVIIILSYISWRFVEGPFRTRKIFPNQKSAIFAGGAVIFASASIGVILILGDGFPARFSSEVNRVLAVKADNLELSSCRILDAQANHGLKVCQLGADTKGQPTFAVWGDSHGEAILSGINKSAKLSEMKGVFIGRGGCLPLLGVHQISPEYVTCVDAADTFMLYLSEHPEIDKVILISRWAIYAMGKRFGNEKGHTVYIKDMETVSPSLEENKRVFARSVERTFDKLSLLEKKIVVVAQVPETQWSIPEDTARAKLLSIVLEFRPKINDYLARQAYVTEVINKSKEKYSFEIVQPHKEICTGDYCMVYDDGVPIYRDSNHITNAYADKLSKIFDPIFAIL
jgi:peptidoglycan/LPS O-acetylase OafA/YrhL